MRAKVKGKIGLDDKIVILIQDTKLKGKARMKSVTGQADTTCSTSAIAKPS